MQGGDGVNLMMALSTWMDGYDWWWYDDDDLINMILSYLDDVSGETHFGWYNCRTDEASIKDNDDNDDDDGGDDVGGDKRAESMRFDIKNEWWDLMYLVSVVYRNSRSGGPAKTSTSFVLPLNTCIRHNFRQRIQQRRSSFHRSSFSGWSSIWMVVDRQIRARHRRFQVGYRVLSTFGWRVGHPCCGISP